MEKIKIIEHDDATGYDIAHLEIGATDIHGEIYIFVSDLDGKKKICVTEEQAKQIVEHFKLQFGWE